MFTPVLIVAHPRLSIWAVGPRIGMKTKLWGGLSCPQPAFSRRLAASTGGCGQNWPPYSFNNLHWGFRPCSGSPPDPLPAPGTRARRAGPPGAVL